MLDVRVAHSMSKAGVEIFFDDPHLIMKGARCMIMRLLRPLWYRRLSARDIRRHAERVIVPELERMRVSVQLSDKGKVPLLHCVTLAGNEDIGVSLIEFELELAHHKDPVFNTVASVDTHAVARLLQRARFDSFKAAVPTICTGLSIASRLRPTFLDLGCIQAAVPVAGGLFVGEVLSDDSLNFSTWFVPGESAGYSRWDNLYRLLGTMSGPMGYLYPCDKQFGPEVTAMATRLRECVAIEQRFPYLFQNYQRRVDPTTEGWLGARRQKRAQPDAA